MSSASVNPWQSNDRDQTVSTTNHQGGTDSVFRDALDRDMIISPSPPTPPPAQPIYAPYPMQEPDTPPTNPHVASLKAIFPDFDDAVILSVLESTHNDHDRALDVLLGMNDPSFVPPNLPPAPPPPNEFQYAPSSDAQRLSQEALDEQLARRLAMEEQHAATQAWQQPQPVQGQPMYQPYHPRRGRGDSWSGQPQGPPQGQGGRDTMTEFQEGFNRIAESGKKTFSSIVSKVKAKMQEFDQGQGWSWSQNPPPGQAPQGASASYATAAYASGPPQGPGQGAYAQPSPYAPPTNPPRQTTPPDSMSPPRSGVSMRPSAVATEPASAQQPSYYDPNTRGYDLYDEDDHDAIQLHDRRTPPPAAPPAAVTTTTASTTTQRAVTPPHAATTTPPPPPSNTSSPPSYASPTSPPPGSVLFSGSSPARSLSPTTGGARGTTPGTPGGVDFSKLGLLPKRPISLVRAQSPPTSGVAVAAGAGVGVGAAAAANLAAPRIVASTSTSTTDSGSTAPEEPEYVENPFEDPK